MIGICTFYFARFARFARKTRKTRQKIKQKVQ